MLLTKEVEVIPIGSNIKYYRDLGYDVKYRVPLIVKVEDLQKGSHTKVEVLCDYCNDEICHVTYNDYCNRIKLTGKYSCKNCVSKKSKETSMLRYNVTHYSKTDEYKEKYTQTCLKKFGVENPLKNEIIKDKIKETNTEKYGVINPFANEEIKEKIKKTILERYGVENPNKSTIIREKIAQTLYQNSSQKVSAQQRYLHDLYGGELNYPISYYSADMYLQKENIVIEYNGGGHMLNVITGRKTLEEYNQKEIIRNNIIKRNGFKQITIISSKDLLPSDEILLKMLDQAKEYFNTTNHTWVEYNIDSSLMRNAENKEGVFFDYGNLRKVKKQET